jgi:ParB family chromosome partitioning protein
MGRPASPRLGRGLAALLGEPEPLPEAAPPPAGPVQTLSVDLLEPGPFQPRRAISTESLAELADSIRMSGVLQPLLARPHPDKPDRFQIIAGERRWRAAQLAGLHELPVHVRLLSDRDAAAAALVENLQRTDLDPIDEAEGYQRLIREFDLTQEQAAGTVGKSRAHVANTLRLLALPESVKHEVRAGVLSAGHARALLAHPDPQGAALAVIARGLNVRQTEELARESPRREKQGEAVVDPDTRALERELGAELGLDVRISRAGRGGTIKIRYASLDQLEGLLALLTRR